MKLIVGLGNPGAEYDNTPHNVGFAVADGLVQRLGVAFKRRPALQAMTAQGRVGSDVVLLAKPQTFMNQSGLAVGAVLRYYRATCEDLLVVLDDADLPLGSLRMRPKGGAAGHRGLTSVIEGLGTPEFSRLRLGIGRASTGGALVRHVLAPFGASEADGVRAMVEQAADAAWCWVTRGVEPAMNAYNARRNEE